MAYSGAEAVASLQLFDSHESELVEAGLAALARHAPDDAATLRKLVGRLAQLNAMLAEIPSLRSAQRLAGEQRDEDTLAEHLTTIDGLSGDLVLPFKATLSRTFLLAKIQFLCGFVKASSALRDRAGEFANISHDLREELAQTIYTQLAEELLLALLRKPNVDKRTKRRAADQLITIWDDVRLQIDDFCPLLESAWHARNSVTSRLGCLLGTIEYFRLVSEDCAPQFLEFFARDEVSRAEQQAFEEFLFNMTYEELQTLGAAMRHQGLDAITTEWAAEVLGRNLEELDHSGEIDPMALYRSYYRRQLAADFRIMADTDGPRRTAEAYMMIWLLNNQSN